MNAKGLQETFDGKRENNNAVQKNEKGGFL
jgi:hypothetical protein